MSYITLEIRITRGQSLEPGKTYLVSASAIVPRGPVKPAQAAFTISSDIEQRLHQILVDSNLRDTKALKEPAARAKEFGIELFNYLFQSEVQHLYHEIKARALRQQSVIRLRLQIVPAELSALPWELLHDKEQYLCLNDHPKILFARVPDTIVKNKALDYNPPLRLLGVTADSNGQSELDIEKEKSYINTALKGLIEDKRVEIEWKKAEASVLRDLRLGAPWHVLHFIGHGRFDDDGDDKEGKLIFEDVRSRNNDFVDANRLKLALHRDIQLVFLNACDTARGDPQDYLSNFAYKLAISGTPAIVAMQFKITDDAAIEFARFFYERVAHGDAVDEAVTEARHHVYVGAKGGSLEWMAPVLYVSTSNGILFKDVNNRKADDLVDIEKQTQPLGLVVPLVESTPPDNEAPSMGPNITTIERSIPFWRKRFRRSYLVAAGLVAAGLVVLLLLATLGGWLLALSHPSTPSTLTTLCLGTDFATSGNDGAQGILLKRGADLAIAQNRNLSSGYKLTACDKDDVSPVTEIHDPATGVQNVNQLIADKTVLGLVGPGNSNVAQAEIPVAAQVGLAVVSPNTTNTCLTLQRYCDNPGQVHPPGVPNTFFRICSNDLQQGQADADLFFKSLGLRTAFVVDENEAYGIGLANAFAQRLQDDGGTILGRNHILNRNVTAQLVQTIISAKPDAVFYGGGTENGGGLLKAQLGVAGFTGPMFGGDGIALDDTFLSDADSNANNTYATALGPDVSVLPQWYVQDYQNSYGKKPDSSVSAGGYDAAMVLITAIKSVIVDNPDVMHKDVGTIRRAVLDKVEHPDQPYRGLTGTVTFDSNGDNAALTVFTVYDVEGGQWVYKPEYNVNIGG